MSSPVTWYRITNLAVALGFAIAKYTIHSSAKVSTLDFAGAVFTGAVLYFIGWWDKSPGLQWYFDPDWQAQGQVVISCVTRLKGLVSIYASEIICVLLLISQLPAILGLMGIHPYPERSRAFDIVKLLVFGILLGYSVRRMSFNLHPLTRFERIFSGITAVLWLCAVIWYAIKHFMNGKIHGNSLSDNVLRVINTLLLSLGACSFVVNAVSGRALLGRLVVFLEQLWLRIPRTTQPELLAPIPLPTIDPT